MANVIRMGYVRSNWNERGGGLNFTQSFFAAVLLLAGPVQAGAAGSCSVAVVSSPPWIKRAGANSLVVTKAGGDLRIFAGTNTLMFLLAFIGAYSAKAPPRVLTIVSAALIAAAVVGTGLYVFAQNWLQTLIFSDYVGTTYIVWVSLIVGVELDLLLNRGRLVDAFVSSAAGAISAISP